MVPFSFTDTPTLGLSAAALREAAAEWTAREIGQQPQVWQQIISQINADNELRQWFATQLAESGLRIILTGAGTSAYIGQALLPALSVRLPHATQRLEAISTTDLVSNPAQYLLGQYPTLLISYGRSGNSPESLKTVQLADQLLPDCRHLIITCNAVGQLAQYGQAHHQSKVLQLPDACHDRSFAMTSSFTGMYLATLWLFQPEQAQLDSTIDVTAQLLSQSAAIRAEAELPAERVVFVGSGGLAGIAREAALKYLELTAGQISSFYESSLGFRHGPKSVVNAQTQVFILRSNDPYTAKYDVDLYEEVQRDRRAAYCRLVQLDNCRGAALLTDAWLALPLIVYCQTLAFFKALQLEISPDNPCPTGEVNRVVQGVTLYPFIPTLTERA
ncbi:tagatose-6-phosphate ketose isomerase [Rheinheimera texasensis]|uniref:tagatose-6-phosphate ketose isomerase n=1 Tax=Rheinheimera texasensis TaxID=306205 RepID=UPI0032B2C537